MPSKDGVTFSPFLKMAVARGQADVNVGCEKCRAWFRYSMRRKVTVRVRQRLILLFSPAAYLSQVASGAVKTDDQARQKAQEKLDERLSDECDVVPCPGCGHIQRQMVGELRKRLRACCLGAGMVVLMAGAIASGILADSKQQARVADLWEGLGFVGVLLAAMLLASLLYNPNTMPRPIFLRLFIKRKGQAGGAKAPAARSEGESPAKPAVPALPESIALEGEDDAEPVVGVLLEEAPQAPRKHAVACESCGHVYKVPDKYLGRKVQCKKCKSFFVAVK